MSKVVDLLMYVFEDVKRFHEAFNHPCPSEPTNISEERKQARIKWIREEIQEFIDAKNLTEEVDAMIDCMYFVIGTIVELGLIEEFRKGLELKNYDEVREIILKSPEYKTLNNQTKGNLTAIFEDIKFKEIKQQHKVFPSEPTRIIDKQNVVSELESCLSTIDDFKNKNDDDYKYYIFDKMNLLFIKILKIFIEMGIDPSYPFYLVQMANMSKLWEDGKPHYNKDNKVIKPDGWIAPDQKISEYLNYIVNRNRYDRNITRLQIIKNYESNNNDDNSYSTMDPISLKTISLCKEILDNIDIQPEIFPTYDGRIQLEWESNDIYIELEIDDGKQFYIDVLKGEKEEFEKSIHVEEIEEINIIINKYKDYLKV